MCLFNLLFIIAYFVKFRTSEFTFYLYFLKKYSHFLYFSVHFFFISVIIQINAY